MPLPVNDGSSKVVVINAGAEIHHEGEVRALIVNSVAVLHWHAKDSVSESFALMMVVKEGIAGVTEAAVAFGCSRMTVYRAIARFEEMGLAGLLRGKSGPKQPRQLKGAIARRIVALKGQGLSNASIGCKLGVSEGAIRKALKRMDYAGEIAAAVQMEIVTSASCTEDPSGAESIGEEPCAAAVAAPSKDEAGGQEPAAVTTGESVPTLVASVVGQEPTEQSQPMTADPWDRTLDRFFARMGWLSEAVPQFGDCSAVAGLGVLLALPAVLNTGLLQTASGIYGGFGAGFYGVRSILLCLCLMALLRVKRAEQLRHRSPTALGRLLGLDRAPEVKTLRHKLELLAKQGKSEALQRALARLRVATRSEAMGFLYVDGHVRAYHGKVRLSKAHVTRIRLSMPATVDHWINDRDGEPLLVLTATATAALAKEMLAIAKEARALLGERRATIIFDRGGWSPKLFAELIGLGFDILTYRKGHIPKVRLARFQAHEGTFEGRKVTYQLAERRLTLKYKKGGRLTVREVVRLSEDGKHQTSVVTNRKDLAPVEVAYRMFERWRQENFFKYMAEEFALDALWSYGTEPADAERDVPNPKHKAKQKELREARAEVSRLERELGAAVAQNPESKRPAMRGFKIANASVGKALREAEDKVERLREELRQIPARVCAGEAAQGDAVLRLKTESKRLTDTVKSVAYQVETGLVRLVRPYYRRAEDEGRKLIASALQLPGDLTVKPGELWIELGPAASPNRTRAIAALCDELNSLNVTYPGTQLRLRYAIREA